MIKEKPCKGQGKAKSVKGCNKLVNVNYRKYGLCQSCYAGFILNTDYGRLLLERATLKATKSRRDLEVASTEKKERDNISYHLEKTQRIVNTYVKIRDKYKPCASQNIPWQDDFDAGHVFSVKQFSALRFDLDNIHGQSINANRFKEGDFENYLLNLPNRIGKKRTEALIKRAELSKKSVKKWTRTELEEVQLNIKRLTKELKD